MPKSYQLSQHLEICENVEGDSLIPDVILEASDEVQVIEVKATEGNKSGGKAQRLVNRVMSCMSSKSLKLSGAACKNLSQDGFSCLTAPGAIRQLS